MHDVAEHAGVSLKSVSRVINDESGASQQTRTRVWTAIRELGYQRNDTAHALRRRDGRSACLGVVLDDVGNTFAAAVHSGVVQVANTHRCLVLAASTHGDPDIERQLVYRLLGRRVDGLVIMSARTDHSYLNWRAGARRTDRVRRPPRPRHPGDVRAGRQPRGNPGSGGASHRPRPSAE
jgi:LacI family transcriptional regulator